MGWIQQISDTIRQGIDKILRKPLKWLPLSLLICEVLRRPGMSAIALTSAILDKMKEKGLPTDRLPDGSEAPINQFVRIISESIITEIKDNARVSIANQPGTQSVVGVGANAGGPITVHSTNITPLGGFGIVE